MYKVWSSFFLIVLLQQGGNETIFTAQNTIRHSRKQQKRKMEILFNDLSACISCLLSLGLLPATKWYEFGYP